MLKLKRSMGHGRLLCEGRAYGPVGVTECYSRRKILRMFWLKRKVTLQEGHCWEGERGKCRANVKGEEQELYSLYRCSYRGGFAGEKAKRFTTIITVYSLKYEARASA